ncbi:aldehyde dehydrogenase family protein [Maribacter sp. 2307ULW6-5]|uniref:aldehyde dehydrogenase family protein n=1 Tax=Maribacter sp. 2307ULW6-5 TaxID=3386275 RepID=UPI0039BD6C19
MTSTIKLPQNLSPKTRAFLGEKQRLLINNEWVRAEAGQTFNSYNPANNTLIAKIARAEKKDVNLAVKAAREAFAKVWKEGTAPKERSRLLWKLASLLQRDREVLIQLETLDNGKPLSKAKYDVEAAIAHFEYYAGWATKLTGSCVPVGQGKLVYTQKEPLGVVGLIVPWNFPLMIAVWKLAPALACGNCCILKPAEQTSLTALYLGKLILEAGFPKGVVNIVTGFGKEAGAAISAHPNIDKVSFTGSTPVGKSILEAAAQSNLKKVSLELGGKSPNVIFEDADLDAVLDGIQWSSFYNSGQECTLGSRIYIQEGIFDKVVAALRDKASKMTIGPGWEDLDLGPLISQKQMDTVLSFVEAGKRQGAKLVCGGSKLYGNLEEGHFMEPTIFATDKQDLSIVQEEIFGPVVVVSPFKDFNDAIGKANTSRYGLAAAVWTKDLSKAHLFANAVDAGTVWINGYDLFDAAVPFGGFKESGNAKEMGINAIELYTKEKAVWAVL